MGRLINLRDIEMSRHVSADSGDAAWSAGSFAADHHGPEGSTATFFVIPPGMRLGWHHNTSEEIQVVLEGAGRLVLDDEAVPIGPGDIFLVVEGENHDVRNTGQDDLRVVAFFPEAKVEHHWAEEEWLPGGDKVTATPEN